MRRLSLLSLTATVVLATTTAATAAPEDFTVATEASGVTVTILGGQVLSLATTSADVDGTPAARAAGAAASIGGTSVDGTTSTINLTEGEATDGANCAVAPVTDLASFVTASGLCSTSSGQVDGTPSSRASADVAEVSLDAAVLVDALSAFLLAPLEDQLADVFETVENVINAEVQFLLENACGSGSLPSEAVQAVVEDILGGLLEPVAGVLPDDQACSVLLAFVADAPQLENAAAAIEDVTDALVNIIAGLDAMDLQFGATSEVTAEGSVLVGESGFGAVSLALPSLDLVGEAVDLVLEGAVRPYLDDLTEIVSGLGAQAPPIPTVAPTVRQVLDLVGIRGVLDDPAPLVSVDLVGSTAAVAVDTANRTVTPLSSAGELTVSLSPALARFLGVPESTTVAPGDEVVLASGTPLESRFAVGAASTTEDSATGEAVTVELLRSVSSGIALEVGATSATGSVSATAAPLVPGVDVTPETGGGIALAGLASLALASRRRRS